MSAVSCESSKMIGPGSLSEIALDTLGKYIYDLCSKLTMIPVAELAKNKSKKRKSTCTTNIEEVKCVCNKLSEMITQTPVSLANDLTNKLLDSVDNWEFEVGKCRKGSLEEEIYTEVVTSVIHPAVSMIKPGQDFLECSEIFPDSVFCSALCASLVMRNVHNLKFLTTLHVLHSRRRCNFTLVEFPQQLVEFSGRCNDEILFKMLKLCKNLRHLNVFGNKRITDASVQYMLELDHLEKLNIAETGITHKGIKSLIAGLLEKFENSPPLKYLTFSCTAVHHFKCLENFTNLKIGVQLHPIHLEPILDLSPLYPFKNIQELQITTTLHEVNEMLKEIGSQLIYLDVEFEHFGPHDDEEVDIAEILKVGQYCTSLKCLHISITYYFFPRVLDFVRCPLPGFQTVQCLTLEVEEEYKFETSDFFYFLLSQCVNVKKVLLVFDRRIFNVHQFIYGAVQFGYMKNVEFVCFQPFCDTCSIDMDGENGFDQRKVSAIMELLIVHCPYLRVIGLDPAYEKNCHYNSQRLKFVPVWCRCT